MKLLAKWIVFLLVAVTAVVCVIAAAPPSHPANEAAAAIDAEIGRASCRERVYLCV